MEGQLRDYARLLVRRRLHLGAVLELRRQRMHSVQDQHPSREGKASVPQVPRDIFPCG